MDNRFKGRPEYVQPAPIILFLQNAWSPFYAGGHWPRELWLNALHTSRSGKRLRHLVGELEVDFHNTTLEVAAEASGICPADPAHVTSVLHQASPSVVVTCGEQARRSVSPLWQGRPLLAVPHPSYRVVTNALYQEANRLLRCDFSDRIRLRQGRGEVISEPLS